MRAPVAVVAAAALLVAVVRCGGDGNASPKLLSRAGFKDKAAAAIVTGSDLQAKPGFGLKVDVTSPASLNTFSLRLDKQYADYRAHRDRQTAVLRALVADAKARMARGNAGESFAAARPLILPILKPKRSFDRLAEQPAATPFAGGLRIAYAVQRPDSFMVVTRAELARWKRDLAEVHGLALHNLARDTNRKQPLLCEDKLCGWASGDGYDAARMLVPELRREIMRKIGPAVYAVPRESVFVALPIKLADRIREKVVHDFVTAPNPVSPDIFVERGGELVVLPK